MNIKKITLVIKILQKIRPIIVSIVEDIAEAKKADSEGGKKVTKSEKSEIIFNSLTDAIPVIEDILEEL